MITVVGVVFSITIVTLTLASTQFGIIDHASTSEERELLLAQAARIRSSSEESIS